ncbi:hypothetical protein [Acinetobacter larvae]|uniref:Uncharacterized protein n=1 Tax=Acinetobacter larvae TaxID=1789224 RepID=A0A1B2LZU9_9GAMM|nr:hypothetical protein [Acinetobacter larvae]AOA58462.1 hypothetical protein BFG52_08915 [Acinetobacter larvae]
MNKIILISTVLSLAAVGTHAAETPQPVAVATNATPITIETRPEILGLWGMTIQDKNKKCTEYYNFRANNEVVIHSAKEWSTGIYQYIPSPDNTLSKAPVLLMEIQYDNNLKDCSGMQEDQTGEVSQYYIRWDDAKTIQFCNNEKADKCFAILRRVSP